MSDISTATILKALGDETRLSAVRKLARSECGMSACDIVQSCASFLQLSQPAVSHHFKKLVAAGVLLERKFGTEKHYELNLPLLERVGIDAHRL